MAVKLTLLFNEETMGTLRKKAKAEGFERPSVLARYLLIRGLTENVKTEINEDQQVLHVPVKNFNELCEYVERKGLGSVEVFATFALNQYMARYPLTKGQKKQNDKSIGNADTPPKAVQPNALEGD